MLAYNGFGGEFGQWLQFCLQWRQFNVFAEFETGPLPQQQAMQQQGEGKRNSYALERKLLRPFHGVIVSPVSTCVSLPPLESVTMILHG